MGSSSIARVLTGWTGTVVCDGITVTPHLRESAASLITRVVQAVLVGTGRALSVSVSSTGIVTISAATSFDLSLGVNCGTRTGFTAGPYSGAASYTGATAYTQSWVPSRGLRLESPMLATTRGSAIGDGSTRAPLRTAGTSRLIAWDSPLALPDLDGFDLDVWHDQRPPVRVTVEGRRYAPLGRQRAAGQIVVEFDVREVA